MIALIACGGKAGRQLIAPYLTHEHGCKKALTNRAREQEALRTTECRRKVHAHVNGLTIRPNFRQAWVKPDCDSADVASGSGSKMQVPDSSPPSPPRTCGAGPEWATSPTNCCKGWPASGSLTLSPADAWARRSGGWTLRGYCSAVIAAPSIGPGRVALPDCSNTAALSAPSLLRSLSDMLQEAAAPFHSPSRIQRRTAL